MMKLSLRRRLALMVVPFLATLAILGAAGLEVLFRLGHEIDQILKENFDSILAMSHMNEAVEKIDSSFRFALAAHEVNEGTARQNFKKAWEKYLQQLDVEKRNITIFPEEPLLVDELERLTLHYRAQGDRFFANTTTAATRSDLYFSKAEPPGLQATFHKIKSTIERIHEVNELQMRDTSLQAKKIANTSFTGFFMGLGLAVLLSLAGVWWLNKAILGPIQAVTEAARTIGSGQLHLTVPVFGNDELGQLATAFNAMTQKIRQYRQNNTESLLRARNTAQATINSFADPIIVLDLLGGVELANPAARELFGVANPTEGEAPAIWEPPDSLREALHDSLRQQRPVLAENFEQAVHFRIDGEERTYLPQARPIRTPEGETLGVSIVLTDVTRFRLLNRLKSNWVATVSHELKTPLTSVRLAVHVLLEEVVGPLEPKQVELLLEARESTEQLFRLIEHLLALAKLEEGEETLELAEIDPMTLLQSAADGALSRAEDKRIEIKVVDAFGLPKVSIDEIRFARALNNLIDNALNYTEPGGKIILSASSPRPDEVVLSIADSGIGIPAQYVGRIFERFFQVPDRDHSPGTGLGLAIVREVVHAHHGEITCESGEGKGTTFRIALPAIKGKP